MTRISGTGLPVGHPFNPGPGKAVVMPGPRASARAQPNSSAPASQEPSNSDDPMADAQSILYRQLIEARKRGTADPSSPEPPSSEDPATPTPQD